VNAVDLTRLISLCSYGFWRFRVPRTKPDKLQNSPVAKVAICYQRVSTGEQSLDGKSGFSRQDAALAEWKKAHPDYDVQEVVREAISGNRKNLEKGLLGQFLEDARSHRVQHGTILIVETFSRLSRGDMQDCFNLLTDIFRAGVGVSFCDWSHEILRSLNDGGGTVYRIAGAADSAHREWKEKQARSQGAVQYRRQLIEAHADGKTAVFGGFRFNPRSETNTNPGYPRWLDVDQDGNWVLLEDEVQWVQKAFRLAKDLGARRIARELQADGITLARSGAVITETEIHLLLENVAVLGHRQNKSGNEKEDITKGVYPAIITPTEWQAAKDGIAGRRGVRGLPNGRKRINLFEKRTFCAECGHRLGVRRSRNGFSLNCNGRVLGRSDCTAPNIPYDELALLEHVRAFRWSDFFGDEKHDAETAEARQKVLKASGAIGPLEDLVSSKRTQIKNAVPETPNSALLLWDEALREAEADLVMAKQALKEAEAHLAKLERRPSSREAEREVKQRLSAFMESDRTDLTARDEFNSWLTREGLVFEIDTRHKDVQFGEGWVSKEGTLTTFINVEEVKQQVGGHDQECDFSNEIATLGPEESWRRNFPDAPPLTEVMTKGALMNIVDPDGKETGVQYKIEQRRRGRPAKRRRQ
ncbi:MAG: recombinase family protein, partial [Parasynechococcus sp.]